MDAIRTISDVCDLIRNGETDRGKQLLSREMPFQPVRRNFRRYSKSQMLDLFLRDGFVDRYSGEKLVFPPVLRIISYLFPTEFPFHPNWKMSECHMAYWYLMPTLDHIVPVARGGADDPSNWVSTSQMRNSIKSGWLLSELGWELHPAGSIDEWDGLLGWAIEYCRANPGILENSYIESWCKAYEAVALP